VAVPLLTSEEIEQRLGLLGPWSYEGGALVRELSFRDFAGSVAFVNRIAPEADAMDHHPDLAISWNRVRVSLTTHSAGGVTERDFALAARVDDLAEPA